VSANFLILFTPLQGPDDQMNRTDTLEFIVILNHLSTQAALTCFLLLKGTRDLWILVL